jgi:hypothetical protein
LHNATVNGKVLDDFIAGSKYVKHFDDYYFVKAALKHPMRVPHPAQAKLFVVPTLYNIVFDGDLSEYRICAKDNCNRHEIMRRAGSFLENLTWFQRHGGRDHVVVSSHYKSRDNTVEAFRRCNVIIFEDTRISNTDRLNIPKFYCSLPCLLEHKKTHDFAMVGFHSKALANFYSRGRAGQDMVFSRMHFFGLLSSSNLVSLREVSL